MKIKFDFLKMKENEELIVMLIVYDYLVVKFVE